VTDSSKSNGSDTGFDAGKAEFFEAMGHPTRIKILEILFEGPKSFSELKKRLDIESSGNLSFHLGKLETLVKTNSEGNYTLTDDGKEAQRIVETTVRTGGSGSNGLKNHTGINLIPIAVSIVWAFTMVAVSFFVGNNSPVGIDVLEILVFGFIASLLIVTGIGQGRSFRKTRS